jgi:hypothetical protein
MPVWKYAKNREVTMEEIDKVLASIVCFKCGKELHSDECPFSKLRVELQELKQSVSENTK